MAKWIDFIIYYLIIYSSFNLLYTYWVIEIPLKWITVLPCNTLATCPECKLSFAQ